MKQSFLNVIAAHPMGSPPDERVVVIRVADILYAFRGSAISQHLIDVGWRRQHDFDDDRIYLRTKRGVFLTHFRSLKQLSESLDPQIFTPVHQNILINLNANAVWAVELHARVKTVDIAPGDGSVESLRISRRHLPSLRKRLGMPLRSVRAEAESPIRLSQERAS
jgi:hypothetical protein